MRDAAKFILSKSRMLEQYKTVASYADIVSFSSKTNYVVSGLLEGMTDCMFSIHSLASLDKVKDGSRVWFFAQAWDEQELKELFDRKVTHFVVDNENDLELLLDYLERNPAKISLLLRMRLKEHTIHTGRYYVYGMYSRQINRLIPELRKNKNIEELGIHFHRKTQNISEWSMKYELKEMLTEDTLDALDLVNMGGGIPVQYKNFRAAVLDHVFAEAKELREWLNEHGIKMIIEPGRFIAAPCIMLQATIKNIYDNNIIINCSVFNTSLDTFIVHHKLMVQDELPDNEGECFTIKGCSPTGEDIFRYRIWLDNPKVGDTVTFLNAGAYNFHSEFCMLPRLETEVVD